jgi:hypothetical protein
LSQKKCQNSLSGLSCGEGRLSNPIKGPDSPEAFFCHAKRPKLVANGRQLAALGQVKADQWS